MTSIVHLPNFCKDHQVLIMALLLFISVLVSACSSAVEIAPTLTVELPTPTAEPTNIPRLTKTPTTQTVTQESTNRKVVLLPDGKTEIVMIYIPSGPFMMGSENGTDDQKPVHEVRVDGFWIGETETTNAQWQAFVDATGFESFPLINEDTRPNHPVVWVSWEDSMAFAEWAGMRLPAEAEWEKAARGTDERIYAWGNELDLSKGNCNYRMKDIMPVKSYPDGISPYGVYDMTGNVFEWTDDWFDRYPGNNDKNDAYGQTRRVLRGGSWRDSKFCTTTWRIRYKPKRGDDNLGFRLAVSDLE